VRGGDLLEGATDGWGPGCSAGRRVEIKVKQSLNKFEVEFKPIQALTNPKGTFP
jgi:hypothetical protein